MWFADNRLVWLASVCIAGRTASARCPGQGGLGAWYSGYATASYCAGYATFWSTAVTCFERIKGRVGCSTRRAGTATILPSDSNRDLRRLVFCGRLETVKGAADAVRILSLLPDRFTLEILGDGPERGRLGKAVQDLQLGNRVRFRGWVDALTRDACLAASGVLLMPSLWDEAFGMAGLEALAQGTPVVAYDVGGISEWCHDGAGRLVPCGDVRQAAKAVQELTENPIRWAAHSQAAKRIARLEFPTGRFGHELSEILSQL